MPLGLPNHTEKKWFFTKLYSFESTHLNLTSEYRQVDLLSIAYLIAEKLRLDCLEGL